MEGVERTNAVMLREQGQRMGAPRKDPYTIEVDQSRNCYAYMLRLLTMDFIFYFSLYFIFLFFSFPFLFSFLFLEQLGLELISHAVTSVTS